MNTLKQGTPATDAYLKVKKAIIQQTLKPGKVLTESYLCETLGLGRSPVRAALQQLAVDGFVELSPGRSARVSQFSQNQIRQIYSIRGMILSHALDLTIDTYTEKDIAALQNCLDRQEAAFRNYEFEEYLSAIYDFFYFIIHKVNNPYLDEIAENVLKRINVFLCLYDNFYSIEKLKTLPLHKKIVAAIQQGKQKTVMQIHRDLNNRILDAYDRMILSNTD
ncbi:MAG: GntR family transcriptional regulator [Oscillospiraceae bacterium]|nr:GntR family transcriptional regulator [Oscillospiraceae bacterium]